MVRVYLYVIVLVLVGCSSKNKLRVSTITDQPCDIDSLYINQQNLLLQHIKLFFNNSCFVNMSDLQIDSSICDLYEQNNYKPLWYSRELRNEGVLLLKLSLNSGLLPTDYNVDTIETIIENYNGFDVNTDMYLDLFLTNGLFLYAKHLQNGKVDAKCLSDEWNYTCYHDSLLYVKVLWLIKSHMLSDFEKRFEPQTLFYINLKESLQKYRDVLENNLNLEYPKYSGNLKEGDVGPPILKLKEYLIAIDYLKSNIITTVFDEELTQSVKQFQIIHGLTPDGVVGKETYRYMLWSPQKYIDIIRVNMERCRWIVHNYDSTCLIVNVPEYRIKLIKDNVEVFASKVIVGKVKNKTPIFQSKIDYLVFNPCWTVPNSIATKKMLPRIKKDSTYLQKRNMFVGKGGVEVAFDEIDFSEYSESNFPFKIYQRSCSANALGKVKFMFSNKYQVFLHDTPTKSLFNKDTRAYSSGCIRVDNPLILAKIILQDIDNSSTPISKYLSKKYPVIVNLKKPIDFNIIYFTCSYNNSMLQFYDDIYSRDYKVLRGLGVE